MIATTSSLGQMRLKHAAGMRIGGKSPNEKTDEADEDVKFNVNVLMAVIP